MSIASHIHEIHNYNLFTDITMQSEEIDEIRNNDLATTTTDMTYTEKGDSPTPRLKPHIIITEDSK